jgi:hypothetical protein
MGSSKSFSSEVRQELVAESPKALHCRIAMLAGIISIDGKLKKEDHDILSIRMEQDELVEAAVRLMRQIFGFTDEAIRLVPRSSSGARLRIEDEENCRKVLQTLKLMPESEGCEGTDRLLHADDIVISKQCCRGSFLKGAYLAAGSVSDPQAAYQLEIVSGRSSVTRQLLKILEGFDVQAKTTLRKGREVVYIKDADSISEVLGQMGAGSAMMHLLNVRIEKDLRNNINREVNCEAANITKTTMAAQKSLADIRIIEEKMGIDALPPDLMEIARLRLDNPDLSLLELGELLTPPLGKSGVNHRLNKIRKIAESL